MLPGNRITPMSGDSHSEVRPQYLGGFIQGFVCKISAEPRVSIRFKTKITFHPNAILASRAGPSMNHVPLNWLSRRVAHVIRSDRRVKWPRVAAQLPFAWHRCADGKIAVRTDLLSGCVWTPRYKDAGDECRGRGEQRPSSNDSMQRIRARFLVGRGLVTWLSHWLLQGLLLGAARPADAGR